jgi:hypothetical protein
MCLYPVLGLFKEMRAKQDILAMKFKVAALTLRESTNVDQVTESKTHARQ